MRNERKRVVRSVHSLEHQERLALVKRLARVACVGAALVFFLFLGNKIRQIFVIHHVDCFMDQEPCDPTYEHISSSLLGKNYFGQLMLPNTTKWTIQKKFPNKLTVHFVRPKQVASISSSDGTRTVMVDEYGRIEVGDGKRGTIIVVDDSVASMMQGADVDAETLSFYTTLSGLLPTFAYPGLTTVAVMAPDHVEWVFEQGYRVITRRDHVTEQLQALQYVLQTPTIDFSGKFIDLRFAQPVVKSM